MRALIACSSFLFLVACGGDDPVSYSEPVGINLKAKSSETVNGTVSGEKGITTETSNPYGEFVANAEDMIARDPSDITVTNVDVLLGANSTGVTTLGEIFAGDLSVLFVMNDTDNSFPVAHRVIDATTGEGPIALDIDFDSDALSDTDYEKLLNGSFKVVYRGPAAPDFSSLSAEADLQITFTFEAYE